MSDRFPKSAKLVRLKSRKPARPLSSGVGLLSDVRQLILSARQTVARGVNAALVMLYWKIGQRMHKDILRKKRADYGKEIVPTLSAELTAEFGNGFSRYNLSRM